MKMKEFLRAGETMTMQKPILSFLAEVLRTAGHPIVSVDRDASAMLNQSSVLVDNLQTSSLTQRMGAKSSCWGTRRVSNGTSRNWVL